MVLFINFLPTSGGNRFANIGNPNQTQRVSGIKIDVKFMDFVIRFGIVQIVAQLIERPFSHKIRTPNLVALKVFIVQKITRRCLHRLKINTVFRNNFQ